MNYKAVEMFGKRELARSFQQQSPDQYPLGALSATNLPQFLSEGIVISLRTNLR
ncbi:MAG TPA: hypothetical protein VJS64_10600 [Pyrinomonadaceae bacterium]|nr:hypothetical protein [Pyrinomonadaceae bacterium]